MVAHTGVIRRRGEAILMTIAGVGFSQALLIPVVGGIGEEEAHSGHHAGLSTTTVEIIVGAVVGGLLLLVILGLLIRCLCLRRKVASNQDRLAIGSTLAGSKTGAGARRSRVWTWLGRREIPLPNRGSRRVPPPIFGSDRVDPDDEFSIDLDTSFVLPELGGPNPHNKFDGMAWVDIKGMDDAVLVDISSDLRKYQQQRL